MTGWKEYPMKIAGSWLMTACVALVWGCAATVPSELSSARLAYQHASAGPAAQLVPAELHIAHEALLRAEESFEKDSDSYRTRDLAYVAQRKAEKAVVLASIATEQKVKAGADDAYQVTQDNLLQAKQQDLSETRTALAASEQSGQQMADQLSVEQEARVEAVQQRAEAELKTDDALAALAKLTAVREEERGLIITLSGGVLFRSGEATLMPGAQTKLDQVADALLASRNRNIVVEGFTDSQGSDQSNLELSQRRADAVRSYLVQRGLPSSRLEARGIGEGRPVADNESSEGRANNRRVEIVLEH